MLPPPLVVDFADSLPPTSILLVAILIVLLTRAGVPLVVDFADSLPPPSILLVAILIVLLLSSLGAKTWWFGIPWFVLTAAAASWIALNWRNKRGELRRTGVERERRGKLRAAAARAAPVRTDVAIAAARRRVPP